MGKNIKIYVNLCKIYTSIILPITYSFRTTSLYKSDFIHSTPCSFISLNTAFTSYCPSYLILPALPQSVSVCVTNTRAIIVRLAGAHCQGHHQHGRHHSPAHQGQEGEGTQEDI